ncbi:hypothetical protein TSOC_011732 [Tetrabaena socialis]|uniref:Uncharacterized protein n=1 Tax=Tetrabaena socialis TaxID=47790 RepID=A0A2J7ZPV8_9CHLO|nr:hypothetical protein TSOC_011732 [Tetrabaena socialis]|eukprot:PNH02301.1 hypothetical protein TSOC_011732 [Tetrabaena socialis]
MPVICLGPVCVPLHLLLPFLVGLLHQYGYLKWFKKEWVTFRFWVNKFRGSKSSGTPASSAATPPVVTTAPGGTVPSEPAVTPLDAGSVAPERQQHGGTVLQEQQGRSKNE